MLTSTVLYPKTRDADPPYRGEETSGGGDTPPTLAPSGERETISVAAADGETDETPPTTTSFGEDERKRASMEEPPTDDVCPICFGDFDVPCRAPCGHWYCGEVILTWCIDFFFNYVVTFLIRHLNFAGRLCFLCVVW